MRTTMKNIIKSTLLLLCGGLLFGACDSDLDNNPTLQTPTTFVLNTPAITNSTIDLAHSSTVNLTCSQPDYGFPAHTVYTVEVSLNPDMSNATTLAQEFTSAKLALNAEDLAVTLTNMECDLGKKDTDFPMTIPVYFRAKATMYAESPADSVHGTTITSNVVALNKVYLNYSLPALTAPSTLYLIGNFCGWDWNKSVTMTEVYGSRDAGNTTATFWHMVYIDDSGVKFNTAQKWDNNEVGFAGIKVDEASDNASTIQGNSDGNISSSAPGWYLMIVNAKVNGRNIDYTVTFNKPNVYLIGAAVAGSWDELNGAGLFTVPADASGEFVSPVLPDLAGSDDSNLRMYVKVPGYEWWKSEFIVGLDGDKISYRGTGGDQTRVGAKAGQKVHLNFTTDTGSLK